MCSLGIASVCCALLLLTPSASYPLSESSHSLVLNDTNAVDFLQHGLSHLDFHETNQPLTPFGRLVEGDLLLSPVQQRKGVTEAETWPNRLYRYQIGWGASRTAVEAGVQFWKENSCITFQEVPRGSRKPRVTFISDRGCWSYVGYVAEQMSMNTQPISIGRGCTSLGTVTHEIGHSLGFYHEQSRSDRDEQVDIMWDNIQSGMEGNFAKVDATQHHDIPYDLTSIMHYGEFFFSSNGQPTIQTKDPALQGLIGQRERPTFRDVALMNRLYKCEELCASPPACQNGGYVTADCVCHCPHNTSGSACETVTGGYY